MSFAQWYLRRGRINRRTYWLHYFLPIVVVSIAVAILEAVVGLSGATSSRTGNTTPGGAGTIISAGLSLVILVPALSAAVARLHDSNRSAWWLTLGLATSFGSGAAFVIITLGAASGNGLAFWCGFTLLIAALFCGCLLFSALVLGGTPGPNRYGPPTGRQYLQQYSPDSPAPQYS